MTNTTRRRAIVTGASRGIGRAVAERLIADGWDVLNLDVAPPSERTDLGDRWVEVDLSAPPSIEAAVAGLLDEGPITGLVNNAAIGTSDSLEDTTDASFDAALAVNLRAPMILARAVAPGMRAARFGRIVNVSSRALLGKTHRTAYAAAKGGILSMARVWALELAGDGITVNTVAPGPIRTALFDAVNPPELPRTQAIVDAMPVGRIGTPDDIANVIGFYMDERSGFVTGQLLYACGGVTLTRAGS